MSAKPTNSERRLQTRAVDHHECPECGAKVGKRCRIEHMTPNYPAYPPSRRYVTGRKYPHGERVTLAWRERLAAQP